MRFERAKELEHENLELKEALKKLSEEMLQLKQQLGAKKSRPETATVISNSNQHIVQPVIQIQQTPLDFSQKRSIFR